jgi:transketolase
MFAKRDTKPMIRHDSQRGYFFYALWEQMKSNKDIFVLTGDLGFGMLNEIRDDYPNRFYNVGAAEQALVDIGVGLAMSGKIPVCYSITPFILYRPFESLRNYLNSEKIPVVLVGGGRDKDYLHDGFSHWSEEDREVMKLFPNIKSYWPETKEEIPDLVTKITIDRCPTYVNLRR